MAALDGAVDDADARRGARHDGRRSRSRLTARCWRPAIQARDPIATGGAAHPARARITGIRLEALPDPSLPKGGPGRDYYGNFVLTGFTRRAAAPTGASRRAVQFAQGRKRRRQRRANDIRSADDAGRRATRDLPPGWAIDATRDVDAAAAPGGVRAGGADRRLAGARPRDADVVVQRRPRRPGARPVPAVGHRRGRADARSSASARRRARRWNVRRPIAVRIRRRR